jgi:hypothetical protein
MKFFSRHENINTREVTTEIRLAHCSKCAYAADNGLIGTAEDCPLRGTFHGERKPLLNRLFGFSPVFVLRSHNLITNVGHAAANGRMSNQGSYSPFVNLAIGIGTNAASASDTALQSEISTNGGARGAATATQVTTTVTNDTTQLVKTWNFTGSFAVTEEGILDNASSGGNLLARQVFSPVSVANGDALQVTHKYQT